MSEHVLAQPQRANAPQETTKVVGSLQRRDMNQPEPTTLQEWFFDTISGTFAEPRFGFDFSGVPALTGMVRQNRPLLRTQPMLQRSLKDGAGGSSTCPTCPEAEPTEISEPAEPVGETIPPTEMTEPATEPPSPEAEATPKTAQQETESAAPGETPASALIVEDSAADLAPGQMKKSEFLAQLRTEVTRTAEAAMAGTGRTTKDCPYLEYWFGFYSRKDSVHIERAMHKYAPETATAATARDYIPIAAARVRRSVELWARTGEITGVPEGLSMGLPGIGLLGGIGKLISGIGSIFFKARDGGARKPEDPRAVQAQLGEGRPLEGGVRSRMESAFGMDFSHVRTHTDNTAAELSTRFNARAFTVGRHVSFGANEYKPGTLVGDALIAHELAHVVQQSGDNSSVAPMETGDTSCNTLEKDADSSAFGAIASLWSGAKSSLAGIGQNAMPRLRSGLRLQRCSSADRPRFISMTARVKAPTVSDSCERRCVLGLGCCTTPRGTCGSTSTSGAAITATVETAKGCTGELAFMQNLLTGNRRRTLNDGVQECVTFTTPHRDGGIPWKGCKLSVTSAGRHTLSTDDCPKIRLREELEGRPGVHMTAASVTESFKMFLLWKPTGDSLRHQIANVAWSWTGSTTRRPEGTDCVSRWTAPSGSPKVYSGAASQDRPVSSPKVQDNNEWRRCKKNKGDK